METKEILLIVLREMQAIGSGWRMDWADFDGRTLKGQLDDLAKWAKDTLAGKPEAANGYNEGSLFKQERE